MVKSSPKSVLSSKIPKLSFTFRVIIGIIAVVVAYLIVKFGISSFEGFTTSSDSSSASTKRETIVNGGNVLEWQVNSNNGYCRVRFRHLNTGKLLSLSIVDLHGDENDAENS